MTEKNDRKATREGAPRAARAKTENSALPSRGPKSCPECCGSMRYGIKRDSIAYKGHKKVIETTAWWCTKCNEGIIEGEALLKSEKAYFELRADVEGVLGPSRVAAIRAALGISQREAGDLLGGGPRAFQKYESGEQAVSVPMTNLLTLLVNEPQRLDELRQMREREREKLSASVEPESVHAREPLTRTPPGSKRSAAKRRAEGKRS